MYRRVAVAILASVVVLGGCSSHAEIQPGYQDHVDSRDDYQQSEEYLQAEGEYQADQQRAQDFADGGWQCFWDPTINDDWHDDYMCSNGVSFDRPYLLPSDSFVEDWEIDAAAAEYEDSLNR